MMENEQTYTFDETELYERELKPLMDRLMELCAERKLPFIIAVGYRGNDDGVQTQLQGSSGKTTGYGLIDFILMLTQLPPILLAEFGKALMLATAAGKVAEKIAERGAAQDNARMN